VARRYRAYRARRRGSKTLTIPLAVVGGTIAGFRQPINQAIAGDWAGAVNTLADSFTTVEGAKQTLIPIFIGFLAHYVAGKLGINRALGRARVPILRI